MGFKTAIDTCLRRKYLDFSGRASRSEYWYYILAYLIGSIVVSLVGGILGARAGSVLSGIYSLALFLPPPARYESQRLVGGRRLRARRCGVYHSDRGVVDGRGRQFRPDDDFGGAFHRLWAMDAVFAGQ